MVQLKEQTGSVGIDDKELNNVKRILTALEKAFERILRRNYYYRSQYPQIALEIEEEIKTLRGWIQNYEIYSALPGFLIKVGLAMKDLESKIGQFMAEYKPLAGKKKLKRPAKFKSILNFANQLMLCWII